METVAAVLDVCTPTISPALIDPLLLSTLRDACARLPLPFASFWGLECALGDERAEADLLIEIRRGSLRHAQVAGSAASPLDALCDRAPAWADLRRFALAWLNDSDSRAELVRNLWVEFDLIAAARVNPPVDALERPSVFWGPDEIGCGDWPTCRALFDYVCGGFAPFPRSLPLASLERAVTRLPDGARVFQLGAMLSRGDVMLRVCVNNMPPEAIPAWLHEQDWPGNVEALGNALAALAPLVRTIALDIDYTAAGIGPRLGLECYENWPDLNTAQWQPLLEHVASLGLIVPSKRAAVSAFPARTDLPWKDQWDGARDRVIFPVVFRNIHHVKLSFAAGAFVEAKAYLGVTRPGVRVEFPFPNVPAGEPDEWMST